MRLITVRGIGESIHINLLDQFAKHFPQLERYELPWSAVYGPVGGNVMGESFSTATGWGKVHLHEELNKGPAVIAGYSGGAQIVGDIAHAGHHNIKLAVTVADPSGGIMPGTNKYGIRGKRSGPWGAPTMWVANYDDVISSCPPNSPLRAIAATSEAFSLGDPKGFSVDMLNKLRRDSLWRWILGDRARYEKAYVDACLYLGRNPQNPTQVSRNSHTDYKTKLDRLADYIRKEELI